jgi:Tol biopolymer transport system component
LIRYFFRGELALVQVGEDGFRVKNLSNEPLAGGRIEIYGDRDDGQRDLLTSLELPETALLYPEESLTLTLQMPEEMPRLVTYTAVYRGRLGEESGAVIGVTVSPFIVFVSTRNGADEIFLMNPDGGGVHPEIANEDSAVSYGHPSVSPDGTKIAFQSDYGGEDGIFLKDLMTGEVKKLCRGYWPSWSTDGRYVVFQRLTGEQKHDLFTMDIRNLAETRLTLDASDNLYPSWSPDGSRIAYSSLRNGRYQVVLMDTYGNELGTVTGGTRDAFKPSWSPDGKHIAFERPSKGVYQVGESMFLNVHRIDLETGTEINLTGMDSTTRNRSAWAGSPTWTPDGREILVEFWETDVRGSDLWLLDAATGAFLRNLTADSPADDGYPAYGMGWP